ncbi:MAG: hypothetical protein IPG58_17620 [Acidobacteria bacterium]|nr:hypothetical protein [Acidobacteriota bacterium]
MTGVTIFSADTLANNDELDIVLIRKEKATYWDIRIEDKTETTSRG